MRTYVALLRGMNVGGRNVLPMEELRSILETLGARDVRTYIQSGNAVFESENVDPRDLASRIGAAIEERHGCGAMCSTFTLRMGSVVPGSQPAPSGRSASR